MRKQIGLTTLPEHDRGRNHATCKMFIHMPKVDLDYVSRLDLSQTFPVSFAVVG
jgi:hypothetical protein